MADQQPVYDIKITLLDVYCEETEDRFGEDEFYIAGMMLAPGMETRAVLTEPIGINNGQTKPFPPSQALILDAKGLKATDSVTFALAAYDEDAGKDLSKFVSFVVDLGLFVKQFISAADPVPNDLITKTRDFLIKEGWISKIDPDDYLGGLSETVPVADLHHGSRKVWSITNTPAKYQVHFNINKIARG
ncbi:hypothetical protein ABZ769_37010 [Streptomyces olivoreticuli]